MEELIFSKLQNGDKLFVLERDRRSGYPIFDQAKVLKIGESKPMAIQGHEGFVNSTEILLQDSVSQLTVYLPYNASEGIYNGIYYTTNLNNIINELTIQRQQALTILNNKAQYESIISECEKILDNIASSVPQNKSPEIESFKSDISKRMDEQEALLLKIAQELGLLKPKDDGPKINQ